MRKVRTSMHENRITFCTSFPITFIPQVVGFVAIQHSKGAFYHLHNRTNQREISTMAAGQSRKERMANHRLLQQYKTKRECVLPNLSPLHYINLSNGIEAISHLSEVCDDPLLLRFTRIQSSHCESAAYDKILSYLDNDLLFSLSCGRPCYVYDFGSRNKRTGVPRAIFLGLQFVKWALAYLWFDAMQPHLVPTSVLVRGKNAVPYWRNEVLPYKIEKFTKKRIRYFRAFANELGVQDIRLFGVYGAPTAIDGCMDVYVKIVREWMETHPRNVDDKELAEFLNKSNLVVHDSDRSIEELSDIHTNLNN